MTLPKSGMRLILIALAALAVAGGGYWALWRAAAAHYDAVLDGWVAQGRAQGYDIAWDDRQLFGFPRQVVMRLINLRWKNTDGVAFRAGDIDIAGKPWQTQIFDAKFKGGAEIDMPFDAARSLTLGGDSGAAHVELDADGVWKFCRVSLTNARFGRSPDLLALAEHLQASALRPDQPPKDHSQPGLTVTAAGDAVTLPRAMPQGFGPQVNKLEVSLRVMDAMPDFRRRDSVAKWNDDSGVVEFDKLRLEWGKLLLAGKGTLGFDDDLQPEGAFATVVGNQDAVLKTLSDSGFIPPKQAQMLHEALGVFAKPAGADGIDGIALPITVQLGGLFLGPVKVFGLPEISWPGEAPTPSPASPPAAAPR